VVEMLASEAVTVVKAKLALHECDCDRAAALLAQKGVVEEKDAGPLGEFARGCARSMAGTLLLRDDVHGVSVRFQDDADAPLMPIIVDTVVRARDVLSADLGVTWPRPTQIVMVRDHVSLSSLTGLPYEAARTTGTVAVAKWGRVTMLSPRATGQGYPFRDTIAHELTHLAITRASLDQAPLWFQEGVAKREEVRWRPPSPFDDKPSADAVARRGIELKMDRQLDNMGPSLAMLPSADEAQVAYAQVTSVINFIVDRSPPGTLGKLLTAMRTRSVDEALVQVTGLSLGKWDPEWRGDLMRRKVTPLSRFLGLGGAAPPAIADSRDRIRLGELLLRRGHTQQANVELQKLPKEWLEDPKPRQLRARALESTPDAAWAALGEPADLAAPSTAWWAQRGSLLLQRNDPAAPGAFEAGRALDPFLPKVACPPAFEAGPLCEAAKAWAFDD
jgi:hypothetical protein